MKQTPLVSVIIPTLGARKILLKCFESLYSQTYRKIEVIVVDNGSRDKFDSFIKNRFPKVKTLTLENNSGYGEAINRGEKSARGKYLLFLNDDTTVTKNFLSPLVYTLENDKKTAIVGPKIYFDRHSTLESTGNLFNLTGFFEHLNFLRKDPGGLKQQEVFAVSGAAMLISKDLFEKVGNFDDLFFLYSEDADLCWRVRSWGFKVKFIPDSVIYHKRGQTAKKLPRELIAYHSFKNRIFLIVKNLDSPYIFIVLPMHLLLVLLYSLVLVLLGRFREFTSIWKGVFWNLRNISLILRKRRIVQKQKKIPDSAILEFKKNIPIFPLARAFRRYLHEYK